jgi:isopropylmalate/homocitrate/citramalate synthase
VGWANPEEIKRRIEAVRDTAPGVRLGLHLHDTRGLGAANFYAALQMGVDLFDCSVAGLGGCPFAGHKNSNAAGNICTEDMVFMCHELGIETGIDLEKLIAAAGLTEEIIGRTLPGKIMHSGPLSTLRKR